MRRRGTSKKHVPKWSGEVTRRSRALALEAGVFSWKDPARIARSLRRSAESSSARKSSPYRAAMSMLSFYINRAGKPLNPGQCTVLEQAQQELRRLYSKSSKLR